MRAIGVFCIIARISMPRMVYLSLHVHFWVLVHSHFVPLVMVYSDMWLCSVLCSCILVLLRVFLCGNKRVSWLMFIRSNVRLVLCAWADGKTGFVSCAHTHLVSYTCSHALDLMCSRVYTRPHVRVLVSMKAKYAWNGSKAANGVSIRREMEAKMGSNGEIKLVLPLQPHCTDYILSLKPHSLTLVS